MTDQLQMGEGSTQHAGINATLLARQLQMHRACQRQAFLTELLACRESMAVYPRRGGEFSASLNKVHLKTGLRR